MEDGGGVGGGEGVSGRFQTERGDIHEGVRVKNEQNRLKERSQQGFCGVNSTAEPEPSP